MTTHHTTRTRTGKDAATDTGDLIRKVDVFTQTEADDMITGASSENYDSDSTIVYTLSPGTRVDTGRTDDEEYDSDATTLNLTPLKGK